MTARKVNVQQLKDFHKQDVVVVGFMASHLQHQVEGAFLGTELDHHFEF